MRVPNLQTLLRLVCDFQRGTKGDSPLGLARILGESGIIAGQPCHGGTLAKSIAVENEAEELIALQALETYRALQRAVKTAPHGKGMDHLRRMYQSALREHPEAQKGGPAR